MFSIDIARILTQKKARTMGHTLYSPNLRREKRLTIVHPENIYSSVLHSNTSSDPYIYYYSHKQTRPLRVKREEREGWMRGDREIEVGERVREVGERERGNDRAIVRGFVKGGMEV